MMRCSKILFIFFALCCFSKTVQSQNPVQFMGGGMQGFNSMQNSKKPDSLQRRDKYADSITIYYKLYNQNDLLKLDSSVNDFFVHYPIPYTSYNLGNLGTASNSYLFKPKMNIGWDAGFHSFDTYLYTLEQTPFYQTTRPFTEFGYLLGAKGEQMIEVKHTQNKKQQLNFSFDYRFSNAPGNVKNQNSNVNNMRITANYQGKRKRFASFLVLLFNQTASSENGGLVNAALLDSLSLNDPYELETRLGVSGSSFRNPFNTSIATGTKYKQNAIAWRQTYDFGQKDSIVKDTVVLHMFYPRIRFQNEIKIQNSQFSFVDANPTKEGYMDYFGLNYDSGTVRSIDNWSLVSNEFSIISYPEKNNSNQFLQLGSGYTHMTASHNGMASWSNYNLYGMALYKNKTRNQLWDLMIAGKLFLNGYHAGDYDANASLSRVLNKNGAYLQLSFQNTNRTPSMNALGFTQFSINNIGSIAKQNTTQFNGLLGNKSKGWEAVFSYQIVQNYQYFSSGFQPTVYGNIMNYIRGQIEHKVKISKHWNWYDQTTIQLVDPKAPVNVPLLLTRQRIAFEGNFYKNLNLSTGLELIYHTNYKADGYMPFTGQFYYQENYTTANRPTANAFLHFMIKRFKGYIRLENLNTTLPSSANFGKSYNFTTQHYPTAGMWFRVGMWWNFIN